MAPDFDLAIVGSGFGGSLLAMIARRLGLRVVLIERGRHPRFAIGESASPLAGVLIEQLADRYDLPRIRPLASYGAWQRSYPHVVCGLKRGFTYFKHESGRPYEPGPNRANQLLVAASPSDEVSDTHWLRADVDHFLVRETCALGVEYLDECRLDLLEETAGGLVRLSGSRNAHRVCISASAVVDATGPRGFLSRALGLADRGFDDYPGTQALYSHFVEVRRFGEGVSGEPRPGGVSPEASLPPYPPDDAALHHVFDEGWMWVLRFNNGVTSAGVAVTDKIAADLRLADGEPAWRRLLARYPSIAEQFANAQPIREFTWMPRLAYRATRAADARWAMLPSAAAFVDPFFSTGIPMTLLGVERIARAIEAGEFARDGGSAPLPASGAEPDGESAPRASSGAEPGGGSAPLHASGAEPALRTGPWWRDYEERTFREAEHTARFIAGCYASFPHFEAFTAYSMFYFAAASYSEMARRLGRPSRGFLFAGDERFVQEMNQCAAAARAGTLTLEQVARAIEPLNIAGLCDERKRNWYGVDFDDVVRGAEKLGVARETVRATLRHMTAIQG